MQYLYIYMCVCTYIYIYNVFWTEFPNTMISNCHGQTENIGFQDILLYFIGIYVQLLLLNKHPGFSKRIFECSECQDWDPSNMRLCQGR